MLHPGLSQPVKEHNVFNCIPHVVIPVPESSLAERNSTYNSEPISMCRCGWCTLIGESLAQIWYVSTVRRVFHTEIGKPAFNACMLLQTIDQKHHLDECSRWKACGYQTLLHTRYGNEASLQTSYRLVLRKGSID